MPRPTQRLRSSVENGISAFGVASMTEPMVDHRSAVVVDESSYTFDREAEHMRLPANSGPCGRDMMSNSLVAAECI